MTSATGLFISFEGGEGSGKTTQINRLSDYLNAQGRRIVSTREPGGTDEAEKIRNFLVKRDGGNWTPEAETLLLYAARSMHVQQIIKPGLDDGKVVISDRFSDSTLAYQGYGHGYDLQKIRDLDALILDGFKPDVTFILDIEPQKGIERSTRRLANEALNLNRMEDRFEQLDISFHEKLRAGFLEIAAQEPKRCHVIDASQDLDKVTEDIQKIIDKVITA
ncbi:MAG: dTMP kinase [Alphaproteobacteria bacterium]|nr:dTMP kinase [Alphaproteobacteria bacterium]HCQ70756.1 dTMP kinase [Rhodospirillaceae bacterium]|tara:strand:+ start:24529 stop:25188 length:660 start_codon:yes stop_codon:yes gene_type:complete